jgi:hypothetical protein
VGGSEGLTELFDGMADEVTSKKILPHKPRGRHCTKTATSMLSRKRFNTAYKAN